MFVLIEGLDLSGKSTLCRELAKALDWPIRHNSLLSAGANPLYEVARQAHIDQSASAVAVGWLFLEALEYEIELYQPGPSSCIQDSTLLLRSIAYHTGLGNSELVERFSKLASRHPKPALAFLCSPAREVRLRRLNGRVSRGNDTPEDFVIRDNPTMFACMEKTLADHATSHFAIETIDTSRLEDPEARAGLVGVLAEKMTSLTL